MNIGDLFFALLADGSRLEADVTRQANSAADKAGKKAGTTLGGRMSEGAGRGLMALGAASGALFVGAVEAGATFEDQLRTINTVAGLTDDELGKIGDDIQALSRESGKSTDDLTAGFYDLVSAGVPASEAIAVLRDSATFATGALGTTGEAVDLVTSAMNAYGLEAKDSTRITDIFAKAVADGKVTAAELGSSIANIAPIAASAGISLEEVSAGYALLTAKGVPAAQAATQMRAAISALLTPNVALNKVQKETGINFAELAKAKGLSVALEELRKATGGNAEAFAKALGSVEAYQFSLAVTGENAEAMATQIEETSEVSGLAADQATEKMKSSVEQGKRWAATLNTLAQDFGGAASAAAPFLMALNALFPALRGLISPAKLLGGLLGGLGGRFAKGLGGVLSSALGGAEIRTRLETIGLRAQTWWLRGMTKADGVVDAFARAIDRVPGSGKVKDALSRAGALLGSPFGKALGIAAVAVIGVMLLEELGKIRADIDRLGKQIGTDVGNQIATGSIESLRTSKAALEKGIKDLWVIEGWVSLDQKAMRDLQAQLDLVNAEIERRAKETPGAAAAGLAAGEPLGPPAAAVFRPIPREVAKAKEEAETIAGQTPEAVASALTKRKSAVDAAMERLRTAITNPVERAKERARIVGLLTGDELTKALASKNPAIRAEAERTRDTLEEQLLGLVNRSGKHGKAFMDALNAALKSKNPAVRAEAERIKAIVEERVESLNGRELGREAGGEVASGLDAAKPRARTSGGGLANSIAAGVTAKNYTPTGQTIGNRIVGAINSAQTRSRIAGVVSSLAALINGLFRQRVAFDIDVRGSGGYSGTRAVGGPVRAGLPYLVNENTSRSEVMVPSTSGYVLTRAQAEAAMATAPATGGGDHVEVNVAGVLPPRLPREIVTELRRVRELRALPGRRVAPLFPVEEMSR